MQLVRLIKPGEKIADLVNEAKAFTFQTGNEHALVTLANGQRALVSGNEFGIRFGQGQISRLFGHTHIRISFRLQERQLLTVPPYKLSDKDPHGSLNTATYSNSLDR